MYLVKNLFKFFILFFIAILLAIFLFAEQIINNSKLEIEEFLYDKTSISTKFDNVSFGSSYLNIHNLELSNNNMNIKIDNLTITPINYLTILFNVLLDNNDFEKKSIKKIMADNVVINVTNFSFLNQQSHMDVDLKLLNILRNIEDIYIEKIKFQDLTLFNSRLNKEKELFNIDTEVNYFKNKIQINGSVNIINFIKNGKLNGLLKGKIINVELENINDFIKNENFKLKNGKINGTVELSIIENKIDLNSSFLLKNFHVLIWGKDFKINNLNFNGKIKENLLRINLLNKPILNETKLDIEDIFIYFSDNYQPKKIFFKSKKLEYSGYFSENFLFSEEKELKFDFNLIDFNYFNKLKVLDIPNPFSDAIAESGSGVISLKKIGKKYNIEYYVKANTSIKIDGLKLEAEAVFQDSKLVFTNFIINEKQNDSKLIYDLVTDNFEFRINGNIDEKTYFSINKLFNLNLSVYSLENEINLNLIINRKNNIYEYEGKVKFQNNNFVYKHSKNDFYFHKINGDLYFDNNGIKNSNLHSEIIKHNQINIHNAYVNLKYKEDILNLIINGVEISGEIYYDSKVDDLRIFINHLNYQFIKNDINKSSIHLSKIESIDLPQKVFIKVNDFILFGKELGMLEISTIKNLTTYNIDAKISSSYWEGNITSILNDENNLSSSFDITIKDPIKFSEIYNFKKILKDSSIDLKGKIVTNIKDRDYKNILKSISGEILLNSENGEFVDIDSNSGMLLSIFNFRTIPDIVKLDFKNVFNEKVQFDIIESKLNIKNGDFILEYGKIKSKISEINIDGNFNIVNKEINLDLEVMPTISNSILFATVFFASGFNPITIAGSSFLEKLIPMPNIIKYQYKINGNFDNMRINKVE